MMALAPTTATTRGFDPCRMAGRMKSVSTPKLTTRAISANSPRIRPTSTTDSAKMPASTASGSLRFTSITEYWRSRGASGAYATTTSWPSANCRGAPGWTISTKVRPLSGPLPISTVAFLHSPVCAPRAAPPDGAEVPPVDGTCAAFTDLQSTFSSETTLACWVCRSKPTPVRSCSGVPPGQRTAMPTKTATAKGISTAAMTLRRCFETGAAGPWPWLWE